MAIHTPIISPCHSEALPSLCPSPVTVLFGAMTRDLSVCIEAERDLEHCGSWDPACDVRIRDAERARTRVLDTIGSLKDAPDYRVEDLPLRRCAEVIKMVIEGDSRRQVRDILALPDRFSNAFQCIDDGSAEQRVDLMIASLRYHLHALGDLAEIMEAIEVDAEINRDDPDYPMATAA